MFVLEALKKFDINENEVEFVIIPYDQIDLALKNNVVSAAHSWDPGKKKATDQGFKVIFTAGEIPGVILDTLCFHQDFVKKHPNEIKKIITIFYEAQGNMLKEPEKSVAKLARFFNNDPKSFYQSFGDIHFINTSEFKSLLINNSQNSLESLIKKYKQFYEERGQLNIDENFDNLLYVGGIN
jgi:ABC-type nitrate/sulfonate/bicarbonate transport system substrate-binding protein